MMMEYTFLAEKFKGSHFKGRQLLNSLHWKNRTKYVNDSRIVFYCELSIKDIKMSSCRTEEKVTLNFVNRDGKSISVTALTGNSILDVVVDQNLDFDGFGACEGTLACSTCHVILEEDVYKKLGSISDEEMDMLDLAYGLTDTSRLGCQVCLRKDLEGMILRVPETVADARVDSQQESST